MTSDDTLPLSGPLTSKSEQDNTGMTMGHINTNSTETPPGNRSMKRALRWFGAAMMIAISITAGAFEPLPTALSVPAKAPEPDAKAWILIEAESGWVLSTHNADARLDPASLTKLMTTYLTFEALQQGRLHANDKTVISEKAWRAGGSRMFIEVDTSVSIDALLKGLIVQSGNDSAIALAEHIGGSESHFASLMNQKAEALGLTNTHFTNSSGLPDAEHYTTAADVARLSQALIRDFPDLYPLFAVREYTYNDITQSNRNRLLWRDNSFDGLKTGHTEAAGYCLAGSGLRDGLRFIAVVMGADSAKAREQAVQSLIEYGFSMYRRQEVLAEQATAKTLPLYKGESDTVNVLAGQALSAFIPRGEDKVSMQYALDEHLQAPLTAGQEVGSASVWFNGVQLDQVPLVVDKSYPQGSLWSRLVDTARLLLKSVL